MVSRPDIHLPVEVQGTLRLDAPTGRSIDLEADGATLRLELPGWREARALLPRSSAARGRAVRTAGTMLEVSGVTLRVESVGTPVCEIGRGVRPTWLARLLGLAPARIPWSALRLLFRR